MSSPATISGSNCHIAMIGSPGRISSPWAKTAVGTMVRSAAASHASQFFRIFGKSPAPFARALAAAAGLRHRRRQWSDLLDVAQGPLALQEREFYDAALEREGAIMKHAAYALASVLCLTACNKGPEVNLKNATANEVTQAVKQSGVMTSDSMVQPGLWE